MEVQLGDLVADLTEHLVDGRPALEDSATLRRLGELAVQRRLPRVALQALDLGDLHGGDAFGSASLAKERLGRGGPGDGRRSPSTSSALRRPADDGADQRLSSRSLTIAGGTTQINKGITATRVLGLPRR